MRTIKMQIELTYDDEIMHGDDPELIEWFYADCLRHPDTLILHSNHIGNEIGTVRVVSILTDTEA